MVNLILRLLITAAALKVADLILPNFAIHGSLLHFVWFCIVLGLLNWLAKPLLVFFSIPLIILSLGLFYFAINAIILYYTMRMAPGVLTATPWGILFGSMIVSFVHWILSAWLRVEHQKEGALD